MDDSCNLPKKNFCSKPKCQTYFCSKQSQFPNTLSTLAIQFLNPNRATPALPLRPSIVRRRQATCKFAPTRVGDIKHRGAPTCNCSVKFQSSRILSNFSAYLMPKRKAKKVKQSESSHVNNTHVDANELPEEIASLHQEVESQRAAIRTISEMEIERLRTSLRLLKSNISKEHLQTPLLEFFEQNLPHLSVSRTEKDGPIEVKWKDKDGDLSMNTADGGNMITSFLQHMSMTYPECSAAMPSAGGFEFSSKYGRTRSCIGTDNLQIKDFVVEEPSETHILGIEESMQTPGVTSQRLSVGMTPKTLRLPKQGEMLLSVHGSPLGVFKENNMDAIHETEEE